MTENEAIKYIEQHGFISDNVKDMAIKAIEEIQQYRAIGTVGGYEDAIQSSIENYNLYREYKAKVQEFETIGTVEEFKALKYKSVAKKPIRQPNHDMTYEEVLCPRCKRYVSKYTNPYCECGQNLDWE